MPARPSPTLPEEPMSPKELRQIARRIWGAEWEEPFCRVTGIRDARFHRPGKKPPSPHLASWLRMLADQPDLDPDRLDDPADPLAFGNWNSPEQ